MSRAKRKDERRLYPLKKWVLPTLMVSTVALLLASTVFLPLVIFQICSALLLGTASVYQTLYDKQKHRLRYRADHITQLEAQARDLSWLDRLIHPEMYEVKPLSSPFQGNPTLREILGSAVQPPKGYDTIDWVNKFSAGVTMSQAAQALSQLAKPGDSTSDKPLIGKPVSHISCPECKAHSMLEVPSENMYYCMACHWYINWANGRRGTSLRTVSIEGEHGPELLQTHPRMWLRKGDRQIDVPYSCPACGRGSNWAVMPFGELRVTCIYCHVEFSYEVLRDMEEEVSRRAFRDSNFDWSNRTMK